MPRPTQYDPQAVTREAMALFWRRGFGGTSVDHLVRGTGLNRHSLYGRFGGKDGLFKAALRHYLESCAYRYLVCLRDHRGLQALRSYFSAITADPDERGCLIANVAQESELPEDSRAIIQDYYRELEQALYQALLKGQEDGALRASLNSRATARWLLATIRGLSVRSVACSQPALDADALLAMLISTDH